MIKQIVFELTDPMIDTAKVLLYSLCFSSLATSRPPGSSKIVTYFPDPVNAGSGTSWAVASAAISTI